jgi:RimJ/RimL family protein N-acetyltransferase
MQIIETARLLLRPFSPDDAGAFFELNSDPEVVRYTGGDSLGSVAEARQGICERILRDYATRGFGRWALIFKETGALIGLAGLKHLDELEQVDLGYRLLPKYWGQGLATEAARASIAYGFDVLRLPQIIGLVDPPNFASVRVLEKSGLVFEEMVEYRSQQVAKYVIAGSAPRPR